MSDKTINYTEEMVGSGHPTKTDTLNRLALVEHNTDGTHEAINAASLTSTGLIDISGAAAGQMKFPATQNPSADANTLDNYKEGTWTPADDSGAGLSLTVTSATYTKIGDRIFFDAVIAYPVTANGSNAKIQGLPENASVASVCKLQSTVAVLFSGGIAAGGKILTWYKNDFNNLTNANLSGALIYISGNYKY